MGQNLSALKAVFRFFAALLVISNWDNYFWPLPASLGGGLKFQFGGGGGRSYCKRIREPWPSSDRGVGAGQLSAVRLPARRADPLQAGGNVSQDARETHCIRVYIHIYVYIYIHNIQTHIIYEYTLFYNIFVLRFRHVFLGWVSRRLCGFVSRFDCRQAY